MKQHEKECSITKNGICCPWMGECECQCTCDIIGEIKENQRTQVKELLDSTRHEGNCAAAGTEAKECDCLLSEVKVAVLQSL